MLNPHWSMIALDLDGTLLGSDGKVSANNREWLIKAQSSGIAITLVTGRHVSKALPFAREIGLKGTIITSNGCEIWTTEGRLLQRSTLSSEQVRLLHQLAVENQLAYRAYCTDAVFDMDGVGASQEPVKTIGEWLKILLKPPLAYQLDQQIEELAVSGQEPGAGQPLPVNLSELLWKMEAVSTFDVIGYYSADGRVIAIDVQPGGVNKAAALQALCCRLDIPPNEVIAFGDDTNDIGMLRWAGLGIAMANAMPHVQCAADMIAPDHDQDGVATMLGVLLAGPNQSIHREEEHDDDKSTTA